MVFIFLSNDFIDKGAGCFTMMPRVNRFGVIEVGQTSHHVSPSLGVQEI